MIQRHRFALPVVVAAAVALAGCGDVFNSSGSGGTISGAGSTLVAPLYGQWGATVKRLYDMTVNFNPIGSGGGIAQFTAGTVDFGATDVPMKADELKAAGAHGVPVHVPTVFGAVAVSYNLPGVKTGLRLDGVRLAGIFRGAIARWDDPAIAALNPGVSLPGTDITVVHRADSSGTTKLFTTFLADSSPSWAAQIGADKSVMWPVGTGAAKNVGVAGAIKQTPGAIGYIELAYALQNDFATAALKNASGAFVSPTPASTAAAGAGVKLPADLRLDTVNSPSPDAYPIASPTFILVYLDMCRAGLSKETAEGVYRFVNYGLGPGQAEAARIKYAPLPPLVLGRAKAKVAALTCNGVPLRS